MITLSELNPRKFPTTPSITANLDVLLERINIIRSAYNKPMKVTSGLRDQGMQNALIAAGRSNAPHSHHLLGEAVDIADSDCSLYNWCRTNEKTLEEAKLWIETRQGGWVHFQSVPPKSGSRFFIP